MGAIAGQIATAGVQAGLNILSDAIASRRQLKHNKSLAAYQFGQNRQLLQEQLAYNTPKAQMERYKDAGLNPNMVLSQGSAGNQSAPLSYPDIKPADVTYGSQLGNSVVNAMMDLRIKDAQAKLLESQGSLNAVKAGESLASQELKEAQKTLTLMHPNLNGATEKFVGLLELQAERLGYQNTLTKYQVNDLGSTISIEEGGILNKYFPTMKLNQKSKIDREIPMHTFKFLTSMETAQKALIKFDKQIESIDWDSYLKGERTEAIRLNNYLENLYNQWVKDGNMTAETVRHLGAQALKQLNQTIGAATRGYKDIRTGKSFAPRK